MVLNYLKRPIHSPTERRVRSQPGVGYPTKVRVSGTAIRDVNPEIAKAFKTPESPLIDELEQSTRKSAILGTERPIHPHTRVGRASALAVH